MDIFSWGHNHRRVDVGQVLFENFLLEVRSNVIEGFPLTFGVFQTFYSTHQPFENNKYLPVVGTLATVKSLSKIQSLIANLFSGYLIPCDATHHTFYNQISNVSKLHDLVWMAHLYPSARWKQLCNEVIPFNNHTRAAVWAWICGDLLPPLEHA